jgi:hypothetical protein
VARVFGCSYKPEPFGDWYDWLVPPPIPKSDCSTLPNRTVRLLLLRNPAELRKKGVLKLSHSLEVVGWV